MLNCLVPYSRFLEAGASSDQVQCESFLRITASAERQSQSSAQVKARDWICHDGGC